MGVLADWQLRELQCIAPFEDGVKRPGKISYGVTSYGYDIRASYKWKVFTNTFGAVVDPKAFDPKAFVNVDLTPGTGAPNYVLVPPNSFALCESVERFRVPRDCLCIVIGKSTYARCGIILNCTPLEPEWEGNITLELSNTTPLPAKIYAGEGVGQVVFFRADARYQAALEAVVRLVNRTQLVDINTALSEALERTCDTSYADKKGKYQDQAGVTLPKVD